ncbi:hypothetical protein Tco_0818853 [Tanacetum coccineum]
MPKRQVVLTRAFLALLTSTGSKERKKLINQSSSAAYLHPGYGAASLALTALIRWPEMAFCEELPRWDAINRGTLPQEGVRLSVPTNLDLGEKLAIRAKRYRERELWHVQRSLSDERESPPTKNNLETKKDEIVPFDKQNDDIKRRLAKNNETKMQFDEDTQQKNVRKFLWALHPKWRAKKDSKIVKSKREQSRSLALKAKKESSDEENSNFESEDEGTHRREELFIKVLPKTRCEDPNHLIGECPKPPRNKNKRVFVGGSWSDRGEEEEEKTKDETCLMRGSKQLMSSPPPKTSPLEDDLVKEEAIKVSEKKTLGNDVENETLEIDEIVNIKESKSHPLETS